MPITKVGKMPARKVVRRPVASTNIRNIKTEESYQEPKQEKSYKPSCCVDASFGKKMLAVLIGVFLVYLIFYFGTLISKNLKEYNQIGIADKTERVLTVSGNGSVTADNNIAITTIGFSNTDEDVSVAQVENNKVMDKILNDLKNLDIEDKDLKTNYTIYPEYNFTEELGRELIGYRVNNTVTIKIRDLSKINEVLGMAGKHGATKIGGLTFTIDDTINLKDEAREAALLDVEKKAALLSESLGIKLGSVVSYNEYDTNASPYFLNKNISLNMDGGMMPEAVMSGAKDIDVNVSVTFEILQ